MGEHSKKHSASAGSGGSNAAVSSSSGGAGNGDTGAVGAAVCARGGTFATLPRLQQLALPRSAARVLAACAGSRNLCAGLPLVDELAERMFQRLGGDLSLFEPCELRAAAFRTHVVDELTSYRLADMPLALGVGVWPLLGTRGHRLRGRRWVDVDAPDVAELRRQLLPQRQGWLQLSSCLCNASWLHAVAGKEGRRVVLVLDESALPLSVETMMRFLDGISLHGSVGSELIVAFDAHVRLRPSLPLSRRSALELLLGEPGALARFPRLRVVGADEYPAQLRTRVAGVNAIAQLRSGIDAPALLHLRVF